MSLNDLLARLSAHVGAPLAVDDSGECVLEFSDERILGISLLDSETVAMRVELVNVRDFDDPVKRCALLQQAMSINYREPRSGIWLGWCELSNFIAALSLFELTDDPERFVDAVGHLLGEALVLRTTLLKCLETVPELREQARVESELAISAVRGGMLHLRA
ncbi:MAG: hypothetical protein ACKODB_02745 [Betaproteobacteria bacterium]